MFILNPFKTLKRQELAGYNTIFQLESPNDNYKPRLNKEVYVTTCPNICRKIKGEIYSPLLSNDDLKKIYAVWEHQGSYVFFMSLTTVVVAIFFVIINLPDTWEASRSVFMSFLIVNVTLFILAANALSMFQIESKKLGKALWGKGSNVKLPKGIRTKIFIKNLKMHGQEFVKPLLEGAIEIVDCDALSLGYDTFDVGNDLIGLNDRK